MGTRFTTWLSCPACDGDGEVSVLAHGTDVVLECYGCGKTAEFTIGDDTPFQNLRPGLETRLDGSPTE
ncbi:hypothetical protein [Haloterrigena alkaliphila]|uniref:hypothetical protein n=1 Tax=Haloterrigena alkaliphila TaxID=2816475 RepID=UPI001CFFA88B|nr:hypothetical protein [Haloterrigena alkaliphila]UHQ95022.1 hypothetical protein J0X25_18890 [Haloterrigena alkaliphila]